MKDQKPVVTPTNPINPINPMSAAGTPYALIASALFLVSGVIWTALTVFDLINRRGTSSLFHGGLAVAFTSLAVVLYALFRQGQKNPN